MHTVYAKTLVLAPTGLSAQMHSEKPDTIPQLTSKQKYIVDIIKRRMSHVIVNGAPGTGKSVVIKALIMDDPGKVKSSTFESYLNIRPEMTPGEKLKNARVSAPLSIFHIERIIIEEYGMVSALNLIVLDKVLRRALKTPTPFGGVQIVFIGDTCQLPPVDGDLITSSPLFKSMKKKVLSLTEQMRREGDSEDDLLFGRLVSQVSVWVYC